MWERSKFWYRYFMKTNNKCIHDCWCVWCQKFPFCLTLTQKVLSFESKVRLDDAHLRQDFYLTFSWKTSLPSYLDCNNIVLVCNFLIYIFIPVRFHKCRGFGHIRAEYPTRRRPVVPHQEKQAADQAKEVIVNNYHFHASLDNVRFH